MCKGNAITCANCGSIYRTDIYKNGCGTLPLSILKDGKVERLHFCSPGCMLAKIESLKANIERVSFEEHEVHGHNDCCHHCRKTDRNARFIIVDPTAYNSSFNDEIGGHFCSVECLIGALRADAEHFAKEKLDKWFVNHEHELTGLPH